MTGENVAEATTWVVDAHLHDGGVGSGQVAAVLNLSQSSNDGIRILRQFHRAGIGQKFAMPREPKPYEECQHPSERDEKKGENADKKADDDAPVIGIRDNAC